MAQKKSRGRVARAAIAAGLAGALAFGGAASTIPVALAADVIIMQDNGNRNSARYTSWVQVFEVKRFEYQDVPNDTEGARAYGVKWADDVKTAVLEFLKLSASQTGASQSYVDFLKSKNLVSDQVNITVDSETDNDKANFENAANAAAYIGQEIAKANNAGASSATKVTMPNVAHVTADDSFANALASALQNATTVKKNTFTNGTASLTGGLGYYLLYGTTEGVTPIWLPYTDTSTTVTIYDKDLSRTPTLQKEVTGSGDTEDKKFIDAGNGDVVSFTLTGTIPANSGTYKDLEFIDTMPAGLTLDESTLAVTRSDNDTPLTSGTGYSKTENASDGSFSIKILPNNEFTPSSDIVFTVTYDAKVNDDAGIGVNGANTNKASFRYTHENNSELITTESDATVVTYALRLYKDNDSLQPLNHVKFTIQDYDRDSPTYGYYLNEKGVLENGAGLDEWRAYQFETDVNGTFDVENIDSGTYLITETVAPDGYDVVAPFELTIIPTFDAVDDSLTALQATLSDGAKSVSINNADPATGLVSITVIDSTAEIRLPITGMTPSQLGTVMGALLVTAGAATILYRRKQQSELA